MVFYRVTLSEAGVFCWGHHAIGADWCRSPLYVEGDRHRVFTMLELAGALLRAVLGTPAVEMREVYALRSEFLTRPFAAGRDLDIAVAEVRAWHVRWSSMELPL